MLSNIEIHASVIKAMEVYDQKTGKRGLEKSYLQQILIASGGSEEDLPAALLRGMQLLSPEGVRVRLV